MADLCQMMLTFLQNGLCNSASAVKTSRFAMAHQGVRSKRLRPVAMTGKRKRSVAASDDLDVILPSLCPVSTMFQ